MNQAIAKASAPDLKAVYRKAAQDALDVQNACNLSGVVFSFNKAMATICDWANASGYGTMWKNCHPIAVLFGVQISYLSQAGGIADDAVYTAATSKCREIANGKVYAY